MASRIVRALPVALLLSFSGLALAERVETRLNLDVQEGPVVSVDTGRSVIVVSGPGDGTLEVAVAPGASITRNGRPCRLEDLRPGDRIRYAIPPRGAVLVHSSGPVAPAFRATPGILAPNPAGRAGLSPEPEPPGQPVGSQPRQNPGENGLIIQGGIQPSGTQAGPAITGGTQAGETKGIIIQNLPAGDAAQCERVAGLLSPAARRKLAAAKGEFDRLSATPEFSRNPVGAAQRAVAAEFPGLRAGAEFDALGAHFLSESLKAEETELRGLQGMGEISGAEQMRLQQLMERRSQMMQTLSNILKKASETQGTIIQNIK